MSPNKVSLNPCKKDAPYIFVSYAHSNKDKVHSDVLELQKRGCNIWLDSENMVGGKPVNQTDDIIRDRNCKALIFYMCERSVCSEYCLTELRVAKKHKVPIIPVHCFPVSGLEETITDLQRDMKSREQVITSDALIKEILKTENNSEVISIPYDTSSKIGEIINSLKNNNAEKVFTGQSESKADITTGSATDNESKDSLSEQELVAKADLFYNKKDYKKSLEYYLLAAEKSNAHALFMVGWQYDHAEGVELDYIKTFQYIKESASKGCAQGMFAVGYCYHIGKGVEIDYAKAMEWYLKAADAGWAEAERWVGYLYKDGCGVLKNYEQAMKWYEKARGHGDKMAMTEMENLIPLIEEERRAQELVSRYTK